MLSLADAILQEDLQTVREILSHGADCNIIDEYGFTPLIEATIVNNEKMGHLLLQFGASPNMPDITGGTALHWTTENNNLDFARLLLANGASPNAYNLSGQSVLVMPILRNQKEMRQLLLDAGADLIFAQDFINVKLLGHMFELIGTVNIIDPNNQFVEVDYEGFFLEITLGLVMDSLDQFKNHFAARQLRRYSGLADFIVKVMARAAKLIKYQQYLVDITSHQAVIDNLLMDDPVLIPIGYEGHAITFVKYKDIWAKCDRREDSRLYDNIMFYKITAMQNVTKEFIKDLIFKKQTSEFINHQLDQILGLRPLTELKVESQISGNCSWANVEAVIPTIFFLMIMEFYRDTDNPSIAYSKTLALNFFHRWREWNKDRALHYCVRHFKRGDKLRKASKAEMLAAVLFQSCLPHYPKDAERVEIILAILKNSPYDYLLKHYLRVFYYESNTSEGKRFAELLKEYEINFKS